MDIYRYNKDSPISHIELSQDAKKVWVARIFPKVGMSEKELAPLTDILNQRKDGIIAVPHTEKGVHTLYASGFESPRGLVNHLVTLGYTKGSPDIQQTSAEEDSFADGVRDASLKLAGIFYLISDAALAVSGFMSKRYKETVAGLLYSSGGVILARYGRKDAHTHLKDLSLALGDFFTQEGITIPKDGPIMGANQERHTPIIEGLERFAYRYPSQVFNTIVAVCGVNIMQSGITHKKNWDTAAGSLVLGGALAGLLIPEKSSKPYLLRPAEANKDKPKNIFSKAYAWAQDRPLKIPGMLWFGNNIAFFFAALKEREKDPKQYSYVAKLGYVAAALVANGLMYISTKKENKRFAADSESMQALFAVAAHVIDQQPKAMQDHIIQEVAGFLAGQPGMECPADQMADAIREQLAGLKNNPFMQHKDTKTVTNTKTAKEPKPITTNHAAKAPRATAPACKTASGWEASINEPSAGNLPSLT